MISMKGSVHSVRAPFVLVVAILLGPTLATVMAQSVEMTDCATYLDEAAYRNVSFALVVDRSGSMSSDNAMQQTIDALVTFIQEMRPEDEAAIISFASDVSVDLQFTGNKERLTAAVRNLRTGGSTRLNDAIAAGARLLSGRRGARVLVVFTDGVENGSNLRDRDVRQMNIGEHALTYSLGLGQVDTDALQSFARATGGEYRYANRASDVRGIYQAVQREFYTRYDTVMRETGGITVHSLPAGRPVLLDGREVGQTPLRLNEITPGRHRIEVSFDRGSWICNPEVVVGNRAILTARERDVPLSLVIETAPTRAAVFVDDTYVGLSSMVPSNVVRGQRDISRQLLIPSVVPGTYRIRVVAAPEYDFSPTQVMEFDVTVRDRQEFVKAFIFMGYTEDIEGNRVRTGGAPGRVPSIPGSGLPTRNLPPSFPSR
jgi:Mg-chelatase subunit ChlD